MFSPLFLCCHACICVSIWVCVFLCMYFLTPARVCVCVSGSLNCFCVCRPCAPSASSVWSTCSSSSSSVTRPLIPSSWRCWRRHTKWHNDLWPLRSHILLTHHPPHPASAHPLLRPFWERKTDHTTMSLDTRDSLRRRCGGGGEHISDRLSLSLFYVKKKKEKRVSSHQRVCFIPCTKIDIYKWKCLYNSKEHFKNQQSETAMDFWTSGLHRQETKGHMHVFFFFLFVCFFFVKKKKKVFLEARMATRCQWCHNLEVG